MEKSIRAVATVATVATALVLFVSAASPANATTSTTITQLTGINNDCVISLVNAGESPESANTACSYTITTEVSAPQVSVAARSATIQAGTTVSRVLWSQTFSSTGYTEVHKGVTYFDGKNAWSAVPHLGYTGSHTCGASGSSALFGYAVDNVSCDETVSLSGASVVQRDTFKVTFGFAPIQTSWTNAMSVLINCNGGYVERNF